MTDHSALISQATAADGVAPFSEAFEQALVDATLHHTHLTTENPDAPGEIVGLAGIAPDGSAELVIHPDFRRRGLGTELARRVLDERPDAGLWAHGNLPAAQALAASLGLESTRELLVMSLSGELLSGTELELPEGMRELTLEQASDEFGREAVERDWLRVNNEAFSWHPEQGGWDTARLHRAMDTEWFDPAGVLFLYGGEKAEELAGFMWTKVHPSGEGEIYVVGLASAFRGKGLGGALVQMGLVHLRRVGVPKVILYVEADNAPAVRRYEQLGFEVAERHVVYAARVKRQ
ncbi:mycothiol synthase [Corynebacterium sp. HMSC071B10]|uniref:mycothiol synthase n=1 Tax=Corynebacterium sp. HMSC071B10 TaxID=1739494 RepID=UPI0008A5FD83|nr:mycothiol synthase [Corynebacterium sp. HMSC071B10]OFP35228.1 mycothiol synthase [Corynebacterium sp. HMSC071B10]